jgi:hypothetical protein
MITDITDDAQRLDEANYLYPVRDGRNDWFLPLEHPGYEPEIGTYVHIRKAGGYVQRGLVMSVANRTTPVTYQVIDIIPAHDVEVTGGTAHQRTLYVCQDITIKGSTWTLKVPALRLVAADAPKSASESANRSS